MKKLFIILVLGLLPVTVFAQNWCDDFLKVAFPNALLIECWDDKQNWQPTNSSDNYNSKTCDPDQQIVNDDGSPTAYWDCYTYRDKVVPIEDSVKDHGSNTFKMGNAALGDDQDDTKSIQMNYSDSEGGKCLDPTYDGACASCYRNGPSHFFGYFGDGASASGSTDVHVFAMV